MIRFPIDLRVALMHAGLRLKPWKTKILPMPDADELDPEVMEYRFNHIHGILCFSPNLKALTIIAISNEEPGNGEFPLVMTLLEGVAHKAGYPMVVGSIWNERLRRHLIAKRGYKGSTEPDCEDAVIKCPA